jgi:hypothetical protein
MQSAKQRLPGASNVYVMKYVSATEIPSRDLNHGRYLEGIRFPDSRLGVDSRFLLLLPKSGFQISEILGFQVDFKSKKGGFQISSHGWTWNIFWL